MELNIYTKKPNPIFENPSNHSSKQHLNTKSIEYLKRQESKEKLKISEFKNTKPTPNIKNESV